MKIKNVVLISLIISLSLMLLILVLGSMLPTSTLDSMSAWFNKTQTGSDTSLNMTSSSSSQAPGEITTTPTSTTTTATPTAVVTTTAQSAATPKPTATKAPTATTTTVATTAPPIYCSGNTPCFGRSDLAAHATAGNCWSYQTASGVSVIYNMSNFSNIHSGGQVPELFAGCGGAINWSGVPNNSKHTAAKANSESIFNQYRVGFYDSTKP